MNQIPASCKRAISFRAPSMYLSTYRRGEADGTSRAAGDGLRLSALERPPD